LFAGLLGRVRIWNHTGEPFNEKKLQSSGNRTRFTRALASTFRAASSAFFGLAVAIGSCVRSASALSVHFPVRRQDSAASEHGG
jgi:hypothetical protein